MNISDEDSIDLVLAYCDNAIQYGEDAEPKEYADPEDPVDPDALYEGGGEHAED